jgi:hypothetical protein
MDDRGCSPRRRGRRRQQPSPSPSPVVSLSPVVAIAQLSAKIRPLRLALCALIYAALLARCWRLLLSCHTRRLALAAASAVAAAWLLPPPVLAAALWWPLAWHARRLPAAANPGHRAGAEGYGGGGGLKEDGRQQQQHRGRYCENTLGALRALLRGPHGDALVAYAAGSESKAYVELDVREAADGALVLLHDASLTGRAFSYLQQQQQAVAEASGGAAAAIGAAAAALPEAAHEASLAQLRSFDLGWPGSGARVATLEEALAELRLWAAERGGGAAGSGGVATRTRRSRTRQDGAGGDDDGDDRGSPPLLLPRLAVDVKALRTDPARRRLIRLVAQYARDAAEAAAVAAESAVVAPPPASRPSSSSLLLGGDACCLIALPWCWESSLGRFGSQEWARWSGELRRAGLSARCVALHTLKLAG